jgi:hypothetical protein
VDWPIALDHHRCVLMGKWYLRWTIRDQDGAFASRIERRPCGVDCGIVHVDGDDHRFWCATDRWPVRLHGLHKLLTVCIGCNLCKATESYVHVGFDMGLSREFSESRPAELEELIAVSRDQKSCNGGVMEAATRGRLA